jgi:glycine/D-amino acid oxidase-like deaminating enzyme
MEPTTIIFNLISLIVGGGIVGSFVTWYKAKPEKNRLVVDAAEGAVIVQTGVIKSLQDELARVRKESEAEILRAQKETDELRQENKQIRQALEVETTEREKLKEALQIVEARLLSLTQRTEEIENK